MKVRCPHCSQPIELVPDIENHSLVCPSCGSEIGLIGSDEATATMPTSEFPALDHFELIEELGKGQFGCVWKARDRELHRVVAIKVPHKRRLSRQEATYFLREARAAAKLNHPNIVSVHEVGVTDHSMYIVSELIDGPSMHVWRKLRKPVPREAARVCMKTARALEYAHQQGVVHRDLKPGNIILDQFGEPHLTDFGLAKQEGAEATIAITGHVIGTPAYMSPEQIRDGHRVDGRSDVYSLGVVLFELLTGQRPFGGGRRILFQQVLYDDPPQPRSLNRDIPKDLQTICLKALEKLPGDRYETAGEFADDLQRFLDGEAITARPTPAMVRAGRWVRQRPAVVTSILLALVVLVLLPFVFADRFAGATNKTEAGATSKTGNSEPDAPAAPPVSSPRRVAVRIVTNPAGAHVRMIPIDVYKGLPEPARGFDAGVSPIDTRVPPGSYLVVAYLPGRDMFHEVFRRVPSDPDIAPPVLSPSTWKRDEQGIMQLAPIQLFSQKDVTTTMAEVTGGRFRFRPIEYTREVPVQVPGFFVDTTETSYAAAHHVAKEITKIRKGFARNPTHPVVNVPWALAALLAERMGKRLLREVEYDYLETAGGTERDGRLWKASGKKLDKPVDHPAWDRFQWPRLSKPIVGIRSGALEWTESWGFETKAPGSYRAIRGGRHPDADPVQGPPVPTLQVFVAKLPYLGFRCARSAKPRLRPEDFVQFERPGKEIKPARKE